MVGQHPGDAVGEPLPESLRAPSAVGCQPGEDGGVHEQPHDVNGVGTVDAGTQRRPLRELVDYPPGHDGPVVAQLIGERPETGIAGGCLERDEDQRCGTLGDVGHGRAGRGQERLGGQGRGGGRRRGALQDRHRLAIAGDGRVDHRLQQVRLGPEGLLDGGHRHPGGCRDRGHGGRGIPAGRELGRRRAEDPLPCAACLLLAASGPVRAAAAGAASRGRGRFHIRYANAILNMAAGEEHEQPGPAGAPRGTGHRMRCRP